MIACMTAVSNSLRIGRMEVWHIMTAMISSLGVDPEGFAEVTQDYPK
jgi:hypothetical protein